MVRADFRPRMATPRIRGAKQEGIPRWPQESSPLRRIVNSEPFLCGIVLSPPNDGWSGATSPSGRRDAPQALGGGRVCPAKGTSGAKVTLTGVEPVKAVLSYNPEFFSLELLSLQSVPLLSVDFLPSRPVEIEVSP